MKLQVIILLIFISTLSFGQFKDEPNTLDIREGILSDNPVGSLFSFIDPSKFSMGHSFEMSYSSFGNHGLAMGVYTNHMSYELNEKLNVELDASFVNTPYNTFGDTFTNSFNGVYIDKAQINYKPSEDFKIVLQYSNSPYGRYDRNYNGFMRRGFSPFSRFMDMP